jgi:hypothetical protein
MPFLHTVGMKVKTENYSAVIFCEVSSDKKRLKVGDSVCCPTEEDSPVVSVEDGIFVMTQHYPHRIDMSEREYFLTQALQPYLNNGWREN